MFGKPGKAGKQISPQAVPDPRGRTVAGNGQTVAVTVYGPDAWSVHTAGSMGIAVNTFSPMSAGMHSSGTARGFAGDRGYGVNRWAGRTRPLQAFAGAAVAPVARPPSFRLGLGAGAAGQPGLPNTGMDAGGLAALAWMGYTQLGHTAMGG